MGTDPKKSAEALKKLQEIQSKISKHQANIKSIEQQKSQQIKIFDQKLKWEQDQIRFVSKDIDALKKQI